MGRIFRVDLEGRIYSCMHCQTHLALEDHILSKHMLGKHGIAYLYKKVVNFTEGGPERKLMITGEYTIAEIFCVGCGSYVGWKYLVAHDLTKIYREGKFVLESLKMTAPAPAPANDAGNA